MTRDGELACFLTVFLRWTRYLFSTIGFTIVDLHKLVLNTSLQLVNLNPVILDLAWIVLHHKSQPVIPSQTKLLCIPFSQWNLISELFIFLVIISGNFNVELWLRIAIDSNEIFKLLIRFSKFVYLQKSPSTNIVILRFYQPVLRVVALPRSEQNTIPGICC